jgi:hypothetical protein
MRAVQKMIAVLLMVLLALFSVTSALAEGSVRGGFAAPAESKVYVSLYENGQYGLYSVPSTGGDLTFIESGPILGDMLVVNNNLYYIRSNNSLYQIVRMDYLGTSSVLVEFDSLSTDQAVEQLSYYRDVLYCLIDGILNVVDPTTGEYAPLSEERMDGYTIADRVIYYISSSDQVTYTKPSPNGGADLTVTAGRPYSMDMSGQNIERLAEIGVRDIQAQGDHVYFYNLDDNYITGRDPEYWLEGKLYRLNMQTRQLSSMNLTYAWDYHATPDGVVVYTQQDISIYPLTGGSPVNLMTPEDYTVLFAVGSELYVYEQTKNILTKLPVNGLQAVQLVGGAGGAVGPETTIEDETGMLIEGGDEGDTWTGDEGGVSAKATAKPTTKPSGTDGSYIFKDSNTKKLTRERILGIKKSLWPYARNEIYARHGYKFKTKAYADYFAKKSWYKPGGFSTGQLNEIEWYNMNLIKKYE